MDPPNPELSSAEGWLILLVEAILCQLQILSTFTTNAKPGAWPSKEHSTCVKNAIDLVSEEIKKPGSRQEFYKNSRSLSLNWSTSGEPIRRLISRVQLGVAAHTQNGSDSILSLASDDVSTLIGAAKWHSENPTVTQEQSVIIIHIAQHHVWFLEFQITTSYMAQLKRMESLQTNIAKCTVHLRRRQANKGFVLDNFIARIEAKRELDVHNNEPIISDDALAQMVYEPIMVTTSLT
ncbi:hypothetical protein FSHL1_007097 [Fusarium sambucinum]